MLKASMRLSDAEINRLREQRITRIEEAGIDEEAVLGAAQDNIGVWNAYFQDCVTVGKQDAKFLVQDQWDDRERAEFQRLMKPPLAFNKLYDPVKKLVGEQRKNKPDLLVRSLTGRASQQEIDLRADLVRTISYQSQNDLIYQTAYQQALMMGFGAFEVGVEYENPRSFNKVVRFRLIQDPTLTSFDPSAVKPHKGDGNFCSRAHIFTREEFEATFPYIENPVSYNDKRAVMDVPWMSEKAIVVCDYAQKEWYPVKLLLLSNGDAVTEDEWKELKKQFEIKKQLAESTEIVRRLILDGIPEVRGERYSEDYRIKIYRLIQNQIIDFSEWHSRQLPIVFVDGDSAWIEGKQYTQSYIHKAKDAQKYINYVGSEIAAEIKNRRREQWLLTPDNLVDGYEQIWRNPETQMGALVAKPDPKTGMMPQKMPQWEISQAFYMEYQRGTQDIKEILGFHEELEGQQSNAQSGKAIANRQIAAGMSAYVYRDNLNQAIEQAGRIVLDLLPYVYGGHERPMIVSKPDGTTKSILLNQAGPNGEILNVLEPGEYDIEIDTGPSFAVQKQQALEMFLGLVQTNPQVFPLVADLIAKNLDIQYMPQVVERFKTLVPEQILAKEEGLPPPQPQPDPMQQMMQLEMQLKMQQMQEKEERLKLEQQAHELQKQRLMMEAAKLQVDTHTDIRDHELNLGRTKLDFAAKMASIMSKNHK